MGNCLRRESSMVWAGDEDWEPAVAPKPPVAEKQSVLGDHNKAFSSSSSSLSSSSKEIKIRITRKQLEELLGNVDEHNMPADLVLSRLINANDHLEVHHQRSWRPRLQGIPEVN